MDTVIYVLMYLGLAWVTAAGAFAFFQGESSGYLAQDDYRIDLGFSLFLGFAPVGWLVCPFVTGFYQYGFNWKFKRREK